MVFRRLGHGPEFTTAQGSPVGGDAFLVAPGASGQAAAPYLTTIFALIPLSMLFVQKQQVSVDRSPS
jgi:hypothetical protein